MGDPAIPVLEGRRPSWQVYRQLSAIHLPGIRWPHPGMVRVVQGTKELHLGTGVLRVRPGEFLWMPGGMPLDIRNTLDEGLYLAEALVIPARLLAQLSVPSLPVEAPQPFVITASTPGVDGAWARVREGLAGGLPDGPTTFRILELLAWLQAGGHEPRAGCPGLAQTLLAGFMGDPARPWALPELARSLAMSEDTLQRRLATEGTGFRSLLLEGRLQVALGLLLSTTSAIEWIAGEVGFASSSRFSARFRERFGVSPSGIRRA